jgi:hypothetical protein
VGQSPGDWGVMTLSAGLIVSSSAVSKSEGYRSSGADMRDSTGDVSKLTLGVDETGCWAAMLLLVLLVLLVDDATTARRTFVVYRWMG